MIEPTARPWQDSIISALCDVLASTDWPGLTNREIDDLLGASAVADVGGSSKRGRLRASLQQQVRQEGTNGATERVLNEAMALGRHLTDPNRFHALRQRLNEVLALVGMQMTEQGVLAARDTKATTLDEVARLAGTMRAELQRRDVHPAVLRYCDEELIRQSLFHAVFEAVKGVAARLREISGLTLDGTELVNRCFNRVQGAPPLLRINGYLTETDVSEQKGFANLLTGIFGTFRNPPAHTPRASGQWQITRPDALDLFSMLSFIHRRLDHVSIRATTAT